jgi:hypothetical protein
VHCHRNTQEAVDDALKFEVLGGKTSREVAEQVAIDARGGISNLENQVNPIGGRPYLANNPLLGNVTKDNLVNVPGVIGADVGIDTLTQSSPARASGSSGK